MLIPQPQGGTLQGIPRSSSSMKWLEQTLTKGCWPVRPCSPEQQFQLSSVNKTDNWETICWVCGRATAQHIHKTLHKSMFDTYQQVSYSLRPRTACCTGIWYQSAVVIYVEKYCLAGEESLAYSPAFRMDAKELQPPKLQMPQYPREDPEMCVLAILKTLLTQKEIILAHTDMSCLLLPQKKTERLHKIHKTSS